MTTQFDTALSKAKNITVKVLEWDGLGADFDRPTYLYDLCSCGCDNSTTSAPYISGSTPDGNGFTIFFDSEEEAVLVAGLLGVERHHDDKEVLA